MVLSLVGSLQRCLKRQALLESGFPLEHPSGAKMLVQPNHYEPLMELMRLSRFKFASWHLSWIRRDTAEARSCNDVPS